jgi:hypothetical protein
MRYRNASSELQINGIRSSLFRIHNSIRQGCPLSMQLLAICVNPLIHTLEEVLTGIAIGRGKTRIAAVAYADDVTVFLTSPADVQNLQEALRTYEEATGAKVQCAKVPGFSYGWLGCIEQDNGHSLPYRNEDPEVSLYRQG